MTNYSKMKKDELIALVKKLTIQNDQQRESLLVRGEMIVDLELKLTRFQKQIATTDRQT